MPIVKAGQQILSKARQARELSGRSALDQITEAIRLRVGPVKLGVSEYYGYRLWSKSLTPEMKQEFVGWRRQRAIQRTLGADHTLDDKLRFYAICRGAGLPTPEIYAVFQPTGRHFADAQVLRTKDDLVAFLGRDGVPAMFAKPARSDYGIGGAAIVGYDSAGQSVELANGDTVPVSEFFEGVSTYERSKAEGHIFQQLLRAPAEMNEVFGSTVMTLRMVMVLTSSGPALHSVLLKIPVGSNMHDNFHAGESGNLVAQVDSKTGAIQKVIRGIGFQREELELHPVTQKRMLDRVLPHWDETLETACRAATMFPMNPVQHWDVAICDDGPYLIEINSEGDFDLHQYCWGKGMLRPPLTEVLNTSDL